MPLRIATGRQGITFEGAFFATHSLALVNRELSLALLETGRFDIGIRHTGPGNAESFRAPRFQPLHRALRLPPQDPLVTIRHQWPPDFSRPGTPRFVVVQPWEFGSIPAAWVRGIAETVDEVWVPTHWVRECFLAGGVPPEKVAVVPNGVDTARFHPAAEPLPLPTRKRVKFLFVGGTIARKGVDALLDAYVRAFTADDDVALVIKDFGADSFYAGQTAGALIAALQSQPGAPEIVHLPEDLGEDQMPGLYAACDCLAHPYRGEGYGLPIAEAMACGRPAIVTGYGAALDFASAENSLLVPATLVRHAEKRIGDMETVDYPYWAEPDREALAAALRRVYEDPAAAREIGARAARDIAARHTWAQAARIAAERLQALNAAVSATRRAPADFESEKQAALAQARAGNWRVALEKIRACLADHPEDWDLVNALGVTLFRLGEVDRARALMEDAAGRAPNARDFHHNLAFLLLDAGEPSAALVHAMKAFAFTPDNPDIRRTLERARAAALRDARRARRKTGRPDPAYRSQMRTVLEAAALLAKDAPKAPPAAEPPARPRVSAVMIVKNEEQYLRECLASIQGAVDEIVVVDTGSTDSTREIARGMGAKVVEWEWTDDFAAARNVSLDHATGDWALWLDADERLAAGQAGLLRYLVEAAEPRVGGYMVNIRNFLQSHPGSEVCWHRACRLFRLGPGIRFTGRIHEQNMRSLQEAGYVCAMSQLTVDHYGYAADVMSARGKHERFIRMLTREVEENRDPFYATFHRFNLANAYYTLGDMENAIRWFERAGESPDPREEYTAMLFVEWATALYVTGRAEEAESVCDRAGSLGIRHPALEFARGHACLHRREYARAEALFQKAIEEGANPAFVHTGDIGAYTYKARYGLALACTGQDRWEEAARHCRAALAEKESFGDARCLLATALRTMGRLTEARVELERLLAVQPDHRHARVEHACVLWDAGEELAALPALRIAAEIEPGSLEVLARLAACCERAGSLEEARNAWEQVRRLNPASAEAAINLGRTLADLGEAAGAIDCFADAIALDPSCANAYFNAADVLYRIGEYPKAAETLCAALELDPGNAAGFFVLGNCLVQTGEYAAATAVYREALARRPDYAEAAHNLHLAQEMLRAA